MIAYKVVKVETDEDGSQRLFSAVPDGLLKTEYFPGIEVTPPVNYPFYTFAFPDSAMKFARSWASTVFPMQVWECEAKRVRRSLILSMTGITQTKNMDRASFNELIARNEKNKPYRKQVTDVILDGKLFYFTKPPIDTVCANSIKLTKMLKEFRV